MSEAAVELAVEPGPVPKLVLEGAFELYEDGAGGYLLATKIGDDVEKKVIPAALVRMVMGNGVTAKHFRRLMGG